MKGGIYIVLVERLKTHFAFNKPIFTNEILEIMQDYSHHRIYQWINEAKQNGELVQYDRGIYYLPFQTEFGLSILSINRIIEKKIYVIKGKHLVFMEDI